MKASRARAASFRSFLFNRSIGQLFNRTHRMSFTAALQEDGLTDSPSMAVKELDLPALNSRLARRGRDEPSRGGGVDRYAAAEVRTEQDSHRAAALGGELESPRFD